MLHSDGAALATVMVNTVVLFRLLVGDQLVPQEASARAPGANWLSEEQSK